MDPEQLIREALLAWNQRDLDALSSYLASGFEWIEHGHVPNDPVGQATGPEAVERVTKDLEETFDDYRVEILELTEIDPAHFIAIVRETGTGSQSGVPFVTEFGYLIGIREGLLAQVQVFRHPSDARAAASDLRERTAAD